MFGPNVKRISLVESRIWAQRLRWGIDNTHAFFCFSSFTAITATSVFWQLHGHSICAVRAAKTFEAIRMHTTQHGLDACSDMVWTYAHAFGSLTIESSNTLAYMLAEAD